MEFRVLGPVELRLRGQQCSIGAARTRCLLAILLLTPGTVVPTETLIDRVWDANPPPKARENIYAYISHLRKSLHAALGDRKLLDGRGRGYALDVDRETVDLHQFRDLQRQASAATRRGDRERAVLLLREAEALWRGEAMAGLGGDWVARMRDSLREERRAVTLERVQLELGLGRHAELLGELRQLRGLYPLDEAFAAQEILALALCGRRGDALAVYREIRRQLVEELGTEPGLALSQLHQRILAGDVGLDAKPAERRPQDTPDTLLPDSGCFVGRGRELGLLTRRTTSGPQIDVIKGMPGVGKTALAAQVARDVAEQYPDGRIYLNLHGHDLGFEPLGSAGALHRLLSMIFVPPADIPRTVEGCSALWRLELSRRRAVVILDDPADAGQVRPLLPDSGECLILITTRRRLPGVRPARTLTLDVLPAEDAVALFTRLCGPGKTDDGRVGEAVRLCGYLPLAIHLLASRLRQGAPPELPALIK
jgi:DNA-binding SARP family transcriptional activator